MVVLMKLLTLLVVLITMAVAQSDDRRKPDRVITITAERFAFNPSRVTVKQGQLIEFVLVSDDTDHGFKIPGAGIDLAIPPGGRGEARVQFIAQQKGRLAFECSRACGAGHNLMRGYIEVK